MEYRYLTLFLICFFISCTFGGGVMKPGKGNSNGLKATQKAFVKVFVNCSECMTGSIYHIKCRYGCNRFVTLPASYSPTKFITAGTAVPWVKSINRQNVVKFATAGTDVPWKKAKAKVFGTGQVHWNKANIGLQDSQKKFGYQNSDNAYVKCLECFGKSDKDAAKCMAGCNKNVIVTTFPPKFVTATGPIPWKRESSGSQANKKSFGYLMQNDEQQLAHHDFPSKQSVIKFIKNNNDDAILILLAAAVVCLLIVIFVISVGLCCYWKRSKQIIKRRIKEPNAYALKPLEFRAV